LFAVVAATGTAAMASASALGIAAQFAPVKVAPGRGPTTSHWPAAPPERRRLRRPNELIGDDGGVEHADRVHDGSHLLELHSGGAIYASDALGYASVVFGTTDGYRYALG
jgi:hypothetical protein